MAAAGEFLHACSRILLIADCLLEQACIRIRDALFTREYLGEQVPKPAASSVQRFDIANSRQDINEQMNDK